MTEAVLSRISGNPPCLCSVAPYSPSIDGDLALLKSGLDEIPSKWKHIEHN